VNWALFWTAIGAAAAVLAAVTGAGAVVLSRLKEIRAQNAQQLHKQDEARHRDEEFRADWYGQPARPGRDPQPGVMERLVGIERELRSNGGGTLRDAVNRLETRFDDHLRTHHQPPST